MAARFPKTLGGAADRLDAMRKKRLDAESEIKKMKTAEKELSEHILGLLNHQKLNSARGKVATVTKVPKKVPKVVDWDGFYKHILDTGHFDLLQKRVGVGAVRDRWEEGDVVPGVTKTTVIELSVSKVRS